MDGVTKTEDFGSVRLHRRSWGLESFEFRSSPNLEVLSVTYKQAQFWRSCFAVGFKRVYAASPGLVVPTDCSLCSVDDATTRYHGSHTAWRFRSRGTS